MATIAEQLAAAGVTNTLKAASQPVDLTLIPFAPSVGFWSATTGWNPPGFLASPPTGDRGGLYWNIEQITGGNGYSILRRNSSFGHIAERQFSVYLFSAMGGTASGYSATAYQPGSTANVYTFKLRKYEAGVASTLAEVPSVTLEPTGSFAVVAFGGKVSMWVRVSEAAAWTLVGSEIADTTFASGFSGFAGNGSNPSFINFATGKLVGTTPVPLDVAEGTSSLSAVVTAKTVIPLAAATGSSALTAAVKAKTNVPLQPANGTATTSLTMRVKQAAQRLAVRSYPPMRLYVLATTPSGRVYRWGEDEKGADRVFGDLSDSDSVPGGYKELSCTLPRKPGVDYGDMAMGTTLEVFGSGGLKVGEYRLERAARSAGDTLSMDPAAYGYQGHLADDASAQEIFIDSDLTAWGEMSAALRLAHIGSAIFEMAAISVGYQHTQAALPAVIVDFSGVDAVAGKTEEGEPVYFSGGPDIGQLRYDFLSNAGLDASFLTQAFLGNNDIGSVLDAGINHQQANATQQSVVATAPGKKYGFLVSRYSGGFVGSMTNVHRWQNVKVLGRHGLTVRGSWPNIGLLASDVIAYALARWAPLLRFTTGGDGTIRPTQFVIPHLAFKEVGPIAEWVTQANRFELNEWGVWNDRTFYLCPRGTREGSKKWVARIAPAGLHETGDQMERIWNGVIVEYQDVSGEARTVGPPGSTATYTDARLVDSDPANPANEIEGLRRWTKLAANGASTPEGAIRIGELFLALTKELDGSGSATLNGYVEDENGRLWPYYCVHAGDLIRFPDATHTGWRYIVNAQRSRADRSVAIDLDAPPDSMSALLERLDVVLVPAGVA